MTYNIKFLAIVFAVIGAFACLPLQAQDTQPPMEGTVRYLVTHNWIKKIAAVNFVSTQRKEKAAYMWGHNSEYKLLTDLYFTPTASKYVESEDKIEENDYGYSWRKETFLVSRDYAANKMLDLLTFQEKPYIVEDSIHRQSWKIGNDLKEVAGHLCMNASWEDTVKLQKITAWFALDIPISIGPERLCGLPGMILEADVNDGGMVLTAQNVTFKKLDKEMELPKKIKGKKVTEAQYQALLYKHVQEKKKAEEIPWGFRY